MFDELAQKAINAALQNDWNKALQINKKIINDNAQEVGALNRISQAYLQLGMLDDAIEAAEEVVKIDPLNQIATKRLSKIRMLKDKGLSVSSANIASNRLFIEEPGKTKIVKLINICEESKLMQLNAGEQVQMQIKSHKVVITSSDETYIGKLPDDIANRIIHLSNLGSVYSTCLKSIDKDSVQIFIREVKMPNEIDHLVSFPSKK